MTVSGVAPPGTAALAGTPGAAAQAEGAQDAAKIRQFDGLMQASGASSASTANAAGAANGANPTQSTIVQQGTPPVSNDVQMTPVDGNPSSLVERLRSFTDNLDTRYSSLQKHQVDMLHSMTHNLNDPMMAMAQAMDFQWTATTTISEYQLSLAVAQATNGLTHSILKNQE